MMTTILMMYVTFLPVIIAGVFNMLFCKLNVLKVLKKPIDNNIVLKDGKRLFGDSKTWKGLVGYILFSIIFYVLWGWMSFNNSTLLDYNYFYLNYDNTLYYNIIIGILLGLGYGLFELPNSFLKRRLDIGQSKDSDNKYKILFIILDQIDSIIGCALVVWCFYDIGFLVFLLYIFIVGITHLIFNMILYFLHLRKNMF